MLANDKMKAKSPFSNNFNDGSIEDKEQLRIQIIDQQLVECLKIVVYYILADAFGWTKDEVDSHPFGHLKDVLFMLKEDRDREEREMMKQSRKKSF